MNVILRKSNLTEEEFDLSHSVTRRDIDQRCKGIFSIFWNLVFNFGILQVDNQTTTAALVALALTSLTSWVGGLSNEPHLRASPFALSFIYFHCGEGPDILFVYIYFPQKSLRGRLTDHFETVKW